MAVKNNVDGSLTLEQVMEQAHRHQVSESMADWFWQIQPLYLRLLVLMVESRSSHYLVIQY